MRWYITSRYRRYITNRYKRYIYPAIIIESLPLHSSQEIEDSNERFTIFKYYIDPTFDFKQELLGRGPTVEVLEPQWFRDEIKADIANMMKNYE